MPDCLNELFENKSPSPSNNKGVKSIASDPALIRGKAIDAEPLVRRSCAMGVECEVAGKCYAEAHGDPSQCGRPSAVEPTHKAPEAPADTPMPAADPFPYKGFNSSMKESARALRYLADNDRPIGGNACFNSEHLFQLAHELSLTSKEMAQKRPLGQETLKLTVEKLSNTLVGIGNHLGDDLVKARQIHDDPTAAYIHAIDSKIVRTTTTVPSSLVEDDNLLAAWAKWFASEEGNNPHSNSSRQGFVAGVRWLQQQMAAQTSLNSDQEA